MIRLDYAPQHEIEAVRQRMGIGGPRVGPPVLYRHHACGQIGHVELHCSSCDQPMRAPDVDLLPGPGAAPTTSAG